MSRPRGKLAVEPLSSATWQRIREEVFVELDADAGATPPPAARSKWRYVGAMVAVAVLATVALLVGLRGTEQKLPLESTSRIVTSERVTRATVGDATLEAAPESELVATGSDLAGWTVVLERGRVSFAVPKREHRPPFRVQAASVVVEVVGTSFTVERSGEQVSVSVERGVVRVTARGETQLLGEGQRWATEQESAPMPATAAPRSDRLSESKPEASPASASSMNRPTGVGREPTPRESYEAASRLEASEPARALAGYLALTRGNDAWAANALYAAGRLELERGHAASARRLLEQYRTRFPNGPNADDARELLERSR